jgi:hypothetical protein
MGYLFTIESPVRHVFGETEEKQISDCDWVSPWNVRTPFILLTLAGQSNALIAAKPLLYAWRETGMTFA